jgi:outer membrane protein assembly factor BamB
MLWISPSWVGVLVLGSWLAPAPAPARGDDWPQWLGPNRDGVWREKGILDKFPKGGPKVLWRKPIGAGYSGPAVADGRVYVIDHQLADGAKYPKSGFSGDKVEGKERVLCLDAKTGKEIWNFDHDCTYKSLGYCMGPRATPTVHEGKVYCLGAMGHLFCLDAKTGDKLWSKQFMEDYKAPLQAWGFAGHPLVDGKRLICLVGGKDSVVVAFDKDTGKELWHALPGPTQGYCPPTIIKAGGKRQLIIWEPAAVNGLDPETGKVYWSQEFKANVGMAIPNPRHAGDHLFVTGFYSGSLLLKLDPDKPAASVVWRSKYKDVTPNRSEALQSVMPAPFIKDGYIYGVCSYGELRCLKEATGERVWSTHDAIAGESTRWGNAFLVPQGDRFFLFNEKGDLIIAKLTPKGYNEIDRAHVIEPTNGMAGRPVVWTHPAFAGKCAFIRNDKEIVCVSLAAEK